MQNIAQFLRNISLTLHQLEHYSFHTSNKIYFLQTTPHRSSTPYLSPTKPQLRNEQSRQGDQPTKIRKTSDGFANPVF